MDKTNAEEEPLQLSEAYVHSLASLGLERLQNEPGRLHAEGKAVEEVRTTLRRGCDVGKSVPVILA